ncbi:MFS transporter [Nocardia sp. NPDC019395]|uniref:MFS transporter n=1 Tax=Nocardia sp. NPDC019395 TaxID=3154686 RepID=UPI00340C0D4A
MTSSTKLSDPAVGTTRPAFGTLAVATSMGTAVEQYDFIAYAIATSLVFNKVFFPETDAVVGTLLAFVVFFTGFLARPVGGVIAGHFGDRIGRKRLLVITVLTMGTATIVVGALPTYEQIGIAAPILLLLCRILQGLAVGGEWGGAALVGVEHAPPGRRGLYGSWSMVGISGGGLLATVAFALLAGLDEEAFLAWGWRVPFLASIVLVGVGLFVRSRITETAAFRSAQHGRNLTRLPIVELLRTSWRKVLLATGVSISYNAFVYLVFTYALSYATGPLELPRQLLLNATVVGLALQLPSIVLSGALSDRIGRRVVMTAGSVFMAADAFVFFLLLDTGSPPAVYATIAIAYVGAGLMYGPLAAHFAEAFDVNVRYSGISLCYQLGASLGGGLTPTVLTLLYMGTGGTLAISVYIAVLALIACACLAALPTSRPGQIRSLEGVAGAEQAGSERAEPAQPMSGGPEVQSAK